MQNLWILQSLHLTVSPISYSKQTTYIIPQAVNPKAVNTSKGTYRGGVLGGGVC